jgi:3-deoxy-7-phosphoheptulonate synthase
MNGYELVCEKKEKTIVEINGVKFGSKEFGLIAGPCAIENEEQLMQVAKTLKENNIKIMRASAYKPRTNPYSFQGMEEEGIEILSKIGKVMNLATETEITSPSQVEFASKKIDVLRVGARNMQNFELLKALNKVENPIILKNGLASTIDEFLGAAEYLMQNGKTNIILCYRGIRTFETKTRFTADVLAISILKELTHLPVIADPSHPAGKLSLVSPLSKAFIATGADGLIVETHPDPKNSKGDTLQQIPLNEFGLYINDLKPFILAAGKKLE